MKQCAYTCVFRVAAKTEQCWRLFHVDRLKSSETVRIWRRDFCFIARFVLTGYSYDLRYLFNAVFGCAGQRVQRSVDHEFIAYEVLFTLSTFAAFVSG